jgi:DNA-binding transcriptional ArsR family regulator
MLQAKKPLGIREIQRALNLSSPSVAQYHLSKLEQVGLLKREAGNFVVNRVLLENRIKVSRFLVPRHLFYSVFAIAVLLIELVFLRPLIINREYFFYTVVTTLFVLIFLYETAKVWLNNRL